MMRYKTMTLVVALAGAFAGGIWYGQAQSPAAAKTIEAGDYASLQAAFDAVPDKGGLVRIPPGEYSITEPLSLCTGDVRVEGSGAATHIINRNQDGQPALIIRAKGYRDASGAAQPKLRLWRVQLANFRVSGNPQAGDGILADGVNEILVDNVSIDHNGGHGLNMVDCYEDPRVVDSIFTYNAKAGLRIHSGHDIVVNGNQFEENQDALVCTDSFNLCMNSNNIDDHLRHGVVIENTYGSVLSGNMIEECTGTGIILDREAYGVTLSANVLAHNNGGGIDLRHAWGSTVSANTFTINPNWSLRIGPDSGRITVTGNNFSNSYLGNGKTKRAEDYEVEWPKKGHAGGVLLDGTTAIALSGNIFAGLIEEAVRTTPSARQITLTGNLSTDLHRKTLNR
jgi:parallel beta-helix repeat protein